MKTRLQVWLVFAVVLSALVLAPVVAASPVAVAPAQQEPVALDPIDALMVAAFLALVANRLIEALVKPLYTRFEWDTFSLLYVSWVVGGFLVWLSGVNLFIAYPPDSPVAGQILTAIVAGGGANFIADIFGGQSTRSKGSA